MSFDYSKVAGQGTSTIDRGVLGMPFINIIQKGSPEFDETHAKYGEKRIEGCRPGNILFEPERAILPQPIEVIPLAQAQLYSEWKPNKGGFVGHRTADVVALPGYRRGTPGTPTEYREYLGQNEIVFTIYFMVLFKHAGKWKRGMIAFTSTQLKVGRKWSRDVLNVKLPDMPDVEPPIFAASYKLSTKADQNQKGGFFSWVLEPGRILSPVEDQALLENSFQASTAALRDLPKALPSPAAAGAGEAGPAGEGTDVPY